MTPPAEPGSEASTKPTAHTLAVDTGFLVTLATALLFVAGWAYAERWYWHFDLGLIGLDIPASHFSIYGYWTLRESLGWLFGLTPILVLALTFAPAALAAARVDRWPPLARFAPAFGLAALCLLLFWGAYALGGRSADRDFARIAARRFCDFPFVHLVLKGQTPLPQALDGLRGALADGHYRVLLQTGNLLALIQSNPGIPAVLVPISEVELMRITPTMPGCGLR